MKNMNKIVKTALIMITLSANYIFAGDSMIVQPITQTFINEKILNTPNEKIRVKESSAKKETTPNVIINKEHFFEQYYIQKVDELDNVIELVKIVFTKNGVIAKHKEFKFEYFSDGMVKNILERDNKVEDGVVIRKGEFIKLNDYKVAMMIANGFMEHINLIKESINQNIQIDYYLTNGKMIKCLRYSKIDVNRNIVSLRDVVSEWNEDGEEYILKQETNYRNIIVDSNGNLLTSEKSTTEYKDGIAQTPGSFQIHVF